MVHYAVTRAEEDPRFAVAETWEAGLPRVQVALYADGDIDCDTNPAAGTWPDGACDIDWDGDGVRDPNDGLIDDVNRNGLIELADVDNYPLGNFPGPEDVDGGQPGFFDFGDAVQVAWSDSWDDSMPTDCGGQNRLDVDGDGTITDAEDTRCFDGFRNWNQVRPGVFDGGWAFVDYDLTQLPADVATKLDNLLRDHPCPHQPWPTSCPSPGCCPGTMWYKPRSRPATRSSRRRTRTSISETSTSPRPRPWMCPASATCASCPRYLSFTTKDGSGAPDQLIDAFDPVEAAAPYAGDTRPLCDRKSVGLAAAQNAATNFFLMTDVPVGAQLLGPGEQRRRQCLRPQRPRASVRSTRPPLCRSASTTGTATQVNRVYSDQFGRYNAVLPSTYSVNLPMPSGLSPNMLVACINDAGPIPNPDYTPDSDLPEFIIDPAFDPQLQPVLLHVPVHAGWHHLSGYPGGADRGLHRPAHLPAGLRAAELDPPMVSRSAASVPTAAAAAPSWSRRQHCPSASARSRSGPWAGSRCPIRSGTAPDATPKTILRDYRFGDRQRSGSA